MIAKSLKNLKIPSTLASLFLAGCSTTGQAPEFLLLNSYFPSWLIGALVSVVATVLIRVLLIKLTLDDFLPLRFLIYVALWLMMTIAFTYMYSPR